MPEGSRRLNFTFLPQPPTLEHFPRRYRLAGNREEQLSFVESCVRFCSLVYSYAGNVPASKIYFRRKLQLGIMVPIFVLLSTLGHAQDSSGSSNGSIQSHTISGQVINAVSGSPIPRALVRFSPKAVLTDHEGRFEFSVDPAMSGLNGLLLFAEKPGFFGDTNQKQAQYPLFPNTMAAGSSPPIILRLYPEAIISGVIQGADNGPLANVQITLRKQLVIDGQKRWQQVMLSRTDSQGEFRFADLSPGDYNVSTQLKTEGAITTSGQEGYLPEHYPPALSRDDIPALHLIVGQNVHLQIAPRHERFYAVTGHVIGNESGQWGRFQVQTADKDSVFINANFDPQTGFFRMMLPNGAFDITGVFFANGPRPGAEMRGTARVTVAGGNIDGVSLVLQPTTNIPVQVENATSITQKNSNRMVPALSLVNIQLQTSSSPEFSEQRFSTLEATGEQTRLVVPNVPPGKFTVIAHPQGNFYVKAMTCGGDDLLREPLTIAPGSSSEPIRIVLQDDFGQVKARIISNGQPVNGTAYLYLVPQDPGGSFEQRISRSLGNLDALGNVAPGNYVILAYERKQELEYRNPETIRQLASIGKVITVPPNGEVTADVELIRATGEGR